MIALLIITSIGVIVYGYMLMSRLDRFIERRGFAEELEILMEKEVLLYGEREAICAISHTLDDAAITYDCTTEPEIKTGIIYHWIGAFSEDDENNLLLCLSAKRKSESIRTMAKCNNTIYESIFRQTGITVILQNDVPVDRILAYLKG